MDFPGGSDGKESSCHARDLGLIPGLERSPGEKNGNPLQYPCLEYILAWGGTWQATVHGVAESDMTERPNFHFSTGKRAYDMWTMG